MSNPSIAVIDYGMGNIHSMVKALRQFDKHVVFTADPGELKKAKALVLPGDGAFGAAMRNLSGDTGKILMDLVQGGKPLLGVCIGFQILFENSSELDLVMGESDPSMRKDSTGTSVLPGLGLIPGQVRRFRPEGLERVPHMGWNRIQGDGFISDPYMYFIHSYRAQNVPEEYVVAYTGYAGDRFPSVVKKDNVFATQFHPEKSDHHGLDLIRGWVDSLHNG